MNGAAGTGHEPRDRGAIELAIVQRAAEWMARLWSDDATESDATACAAWRAQHPDHERAWNRLQRIEHKLGDLPPSAMHSALLEPSTGFSRSRRRLLQALGLATVGIGLGGMVRRSDTWQAATADHHTAVGEMREIALADGTRVVLDTASAIDVRFTRRERRIVLRGGTVLVTSAPDVSAIPRPLLVETHEGTVHAIGTRFSVRQNDGQSHVVLFDGAVELRPTQEPAAVVRLAPGQSAGFSLSHVLLPEASGNAADAWAQGALVAERMRLDDFLQEIGRYRRGVLRCGDDVADMRVTGVFSLRDTDRALANLALGLPVDIVYRTRFWVGVHPRAS